MAIERSSDEPDALIMQAKVQLYEQRWLSICSQPDSFSSPTWHADVLAERRQRLLDGSAKRLSWHEAKTQLQGLSE
jgi:Putative addiction module component.